MKQDFTGRVVRMMLGTVLCALLFFLVFLSTTKVVTAIFLPPRLQQSEHLLPVTTDSALSGQPEQGGDETEGVRMLSVESPLQLVFIPDEEGKLKHIYLTRLDCTRGTLRVIEIPADTRIVTSTELYKKMVNENAAVPQIVVLSEFYSYFNSEAAYRYAILALSEVIPASFDYYTVLPEAAYREVFQENPASFRYAQFLQANLAETVKTGGGMKAYLTGIWEQCESSLAVSKKLLYLETYEGLTNKRIFYEVIPGEQHNNGYEINCSPTFFNPVQ